MFHMRETVSPDQLPTPSQRPSGQKWIFAMKEPPMYSEFSADAFNGFFDWTMTYKLDSDIPWTYGGFNERPKPRKLQDYYALKTAQLYELKHHKSVLMFALFNQMFTISID